MRLPSIVVIAAVALASCKQAPSESQPGGAPTSLTEAATDPADPANNLPANFPSDANLSEALLAAHSHGCVKEELYRRSDVPWMSGSAPLKQVVKERDALIARVTQSTQVKETGTSVLATLSATGEPVNFVLHYDVYSLKNAGVTDPLDIEVTKEISNEGRLMGSTYRISACRVVPANVTITDHEVDPNSPKSATIRYTVSYGASSAAALIAGMSDINPGFGTASAGPASAPDRNGIATIHHYDATGWKIEQANLR